MEFGIFILMQQRGYHQTSAAGRFGSGAAWQIRW